MSSEYASSRNSHISDGNENITSFCGCTGGFAVSEWLAAKFATLLEKEWARPGSIKEHLTEAFLRADARVLQPKSGFFGALGERGLGGSKCGATAAIALILKVSQGRSQPYLKDQNTDLPQSNQAAHKLT